MFSSSSGVCFRGPIRLSLSSLSLWVSLGALFLTPLLKVGACYAAGLAVGFWHSTDELAQKWKESGRFVPAMPPAQRARLLWDWNKAVRRAMGWVRAEGATGA